MSMELPYHQDSSSKENSEPIPDEPCIHPPHSSVIEIDGNPFLVLGNSNTGTNNSFSAVDDDDDDDEDGNDTYIVHMPKDMGGDMINTVMNDGENTELINQTEGNCGVCACTAAELQEEGIDNAKMIITPCHHNICSECMREHVLFCIEHVKYPVECAQCAEKIPRDIFASIIGKDAEERLDRLELQNHLQRDPTIRFCPKPDCGFCVVIGPEQHLCPYILCPKCDTVFCTRCKNIAHGLDPCTRPDLSSSVKLCPTCSSPIEKKADGGCNHVHCIICKNDFCWLCSKSLSSVEEISHFMSMNGCTLYGEKRWSDKKINFIRSSSPFWVPFAIVGGLAAVPFMALISSCAMGVESAKKRRNRFMKMFWGITMGSLSLLVTIPAIAGTAVYMSLRGLYFAYVKLPVLKVRGWLFNGKVVEPPINITPQTLSF